MNDFINVTTPEPTTQENLSDFFNIIEAQQPEQPEQPKQPEQPEAKKQHPEFAARVIYGLIKSVLNGVCIWRTGKTFDKHGVDIDKDKDDFIEILSEGFKTGAIKQPSNTFIALIFLLSFFSEPVYFLITYNNDKNGLQETQTVEVKTETKKKRKPHKPDCQCVVCKQRRK